MSSSVHPSYEGAVKSACERYPEQAGPLFHAYRDLTLSQRWLEVKPIEVPDLQLYVLEGRAKSSDPVRIVLPMALDKSTDTAFLSSIFSGMKPSPEEVTLGIVSTDSSIVYYVLSSVQEYMYTANAYRPGFRPPREVPK